MQVATNYLNKIIKSTIESATSTATTIVSTNEFNCSFLALHDPGEFENCSKLLKSFYTTSADNHQIFSTNDPVLDNFNELNQKLINNNNEFMDDEHIMAGANCKRYLQNKSGERKRRRTNVTLSDAPEREDTSVNSSPPLPPRMRQTRQTVQRLQISTSNLNSDIKSDVQARCASSRKQLRSSKQDPATEDDTPLDYELENPSLQTEFSISLPKSDKSELHQPSEEKDMYKDLFLENGRHDLKTERLEMLNKDKQDDDVVERYDETTQENEENDDDDEEDDYDEEDTLEEPTDDGKHNDDEDLGEGKQNNKEKQEDYSESQNSFVNIHNSCSSSNSRPQFNEAPLSSSYPDRTRYEATHSQPSEPNDVLTHEHKGITDLDLGQEKKKVNSKPHIEIENSLSNENSQTNAERGQEENPKELIERENVELLKVDVEDNENKVIQILSAETFTITKPLLSRTLSRPSHFGSLDEEYGNELSSNSSSISSDTSTTSSCKTTSEDNEDYSNVCKLRLKDNIKIQQGHQQGYEPTNMQTTSSNLFNTQHPPPSTEFDNSSSQRELKEQYQRYDPDENNGCAIKSPICSITSPPPPSKISSPSTQTDLHTSHEQAINSNFHCAIKDEAVTLPGEDRVQDTYKSSSQNSLIQKEAPESGKSSSLNVLEMSHSNDFIDTNLKIPESLNCKIEPEIEHTQRSNAIDEGEGKQAKEDDEKIRLRNQKHEEEQDFDKYLESSQAQHTKFDMDRNDASHQQHEKDIIDAADKVYTQIEQQQQQYHQHVTASYQHMINDHRNQQQQHHDNHQRHDVERQQQEHLALIQSHQHSMQQHYASEQMYQLQQQQQQQQQEQQQQLHIQQQLLLQQQDQQQQQHQQHHNLSQNQTPEQRQQHSHMMDFLHPQHHSTANTHSPLHQQQQQIHEVYHDLMMDEFHEDHNTPYKLGLSPSNVKHENQDDGYETSAGDVLTPNSHASSTHSVTPQHHVQHSTGGLIANAVKCEDQQQQHLQLQQQSHINSHAMSKNSNLQQELTTNDTTAIIPNRDPYHFIEDDLNAGGNNSLRNILTPPHSHTRGNQEAASGNFLTMQSDGSAAGMHPTHELFGLSNPATGHHSQQQTCTDLNSSTEMVHTEHQQQHFSASGSADMSGADHGSMLHLQTKPPQKRRGRKKKMPEGLPSTMDRSNVNDVNVSGGLAKTKERKKHDRFNGMSEEEVVKRTLPDHLCDNLDIVIIGINPGLFAAYKGHHYAGPGNHFWKCLYLSGLTQEQMNADEDFKLIKYGIGFTNMVQRATKGSADLTRKEIKEGSRILLEKLQRFRPKIAVFNGKLIFEVFSGKKDFNFGRQPECVEGTDTFIWVMPSSSARCAQLPRAADKVPFYAALKKFRDYLKGLIPHIDEAECVFTEERIKQQCEQENFKNHQNAPNSTGSYANGGVNIPSNDSPAGYPFDSETNPHSLAGGPGPPGTGSSESFMMSSLVGGQHEKKKRGRPKKIKGQEIIDPVTGNKIIQTSSHMQPHVGGGDYTNILNLSMVQGANSEIPKKKRGRPKKVKPPTLQMDMLQHETQSSLMTQKPNIMSIQSMTGDITQGSPQRQGLQTKHHALYSTPPHQRSIYSPMASPMASPSLNCSYTTNTPPSQPQHDKLGLSGSGREAVKTSPTDLVSSHHHQIQDQNLGESPPPSSPNICTVDFEPPSAAGAGSVNNGNERVDTDMNGIHQRLQNTHQRSRYNSPINQEVTTEHNSTEHFQQWLSPQHNHAHSPAAAATAVFANSPQQSSLHYHDQQQMQTLQQHQDLHAQWPLRHQSRYEDATSSPYMLNSPQLHHTHPHTHHHHTSQHQNQNSGSDVARKSLSGLESLVDQIPTISESESVVLSSAAAVNAQAAAAAAVESRLQGMQNTLSDSQLPDSHFVNPTGTPNALTASNSSTTSANNNNNQQSSSSTNLLNSNFSVSNLAASSASSNSNNNSHESYGLTPNARPPTNTYHHSNLMAAAVLAAAAANSPTNLSTSTATSAAAAHHAQMYMDPHAHLTTHVPVNSIYPPPSSHHHPTTAAHAAAAHHHHAHHAAAAAAHYSSAQHTAADYASNPYAAAVQGNVNSAHTLHMPSPNYPYGYATASSQSNYSGYPHSHPTHHGHPHAHHTAHHLAMFDRLKPSDIGGYSGF